MFRSPTRLHQVSAWQAGRWLQQTLARVAATKGNRADLRLGPASDLQPFDAHVRLRRRSDSSLCRWRIGDRFNQPLPATMAGSHVHGPSSATAIPDLPAPVIAVSRNGEYVRNRGGDYHAAEHSNQK